MRIDAVDSCPNSLNKDEKVDQLISSDSIATKKKKTFQASARQIHRIVANTPNLIGYYFFQQTKWHRQQH